MMTESQLEAYVAWVNSQLKKKPGSHMIEDLRCDMQDGVALANLIEIVAGVKLNEIHSAPSNTEQMLDNVNKSLDFMASNRIRMHQTTAKDIVDGNMKVLMRLILALAAHFKPNNIRYSPNSSLRQHSVSGIAQGAAAALADARRDASFSYRRPKRPKHLMGDKLDARSRGTGSDGSENVPYHAVHARDQEDFDGASSGSSPRSSISSPSSFHKTEYPMPITKSKSQDFLLGNSVSHRKPTPESEQLDINGNQWKNFINEHEKLCEDVVCAKSSLITLQNLLLCDQPSDDAESIEGASFVESILPQEQIILLSSQLQQSEIITRDVKKELSRCKQDSLQLQASKTGLQERLAEQQESISKLKAELLRVSFAQQSLESDKIEMEKQIKEKDKLLLELKKELGIRDRQVEDLMTNLQLQHQEKEQATRTLRKQIHDLHEKLKRVGDTEANLTARVASQDRKMARLEGRIMQSHDRIATRSGHSTGSDEMARVRDSIHSLRSNLNLGDPQHKAIDLLETSISSLMERLYLSEQASRMTQSGASGSERSHQIYDSTTEARRSPISGLHGFIASRGDSNSQNSTKILYYMDRTVTPFMCTIPKRLEDITLYDIKLLVDRPGLYRYHFKSMDPEFGTVKEEVAHDDDPVPGWEGKVVVWIEEDHG